MADAVHHSDKILRCISDGVITTDTEGIVTYMNPVAERLTGVSFRDAIGMPFTELMQLHREGDGETVFTRDRDELTSDHVAMLYAIDGQQYSVSYSITALDDDGKFIGYVVALHDLTNEYDLSKKLKWQMLHDSLTQAKNRQAFELRIQNILEGRYKDKEYALLYMDVDHFRVINELGGTESGDRALRQISDALGHQLRGDDLLCRVGGDEFAIILEDCHIRQAEEIGNRLLSNVSGISVAMGEKDFKLTVSAGLVPIGGPLASLDEVVANANRCCTIARERGGDLLYVYDEEDVGIARRKDELASFHDLQQALENDSFSLSWQPIKPASENAEFECLYEFLLRLHVSDEEVLLPDRFIPAAERYGLMVKLDQWVIRHAMAVIATQESGDYLYNINLSGHTLADPDSLKFITQTIKDMHVDPSCLCFEITETAVVNSFVTAKGMIDGLRKLGCRFALDDFGTGLSSFAYLKHFKVDMIKIDGEFIRNVCRDRIDQTMVHIVQTAANDLGITTIAEWVEDKQSAELLASMGIEYLQGFFIGLPEPVKPVVRH